MLERQDGISTTTRTQKTINRYIFFVKWPCPECKNPSKFDWWQVAESQLVPEVDDMMTLKILSKRGNIEKNIYDKLTIMFCLIRGDRPI